MAALEGTITATGTTATLEIAGTFNLSLSGFGSANVDLERSINGTDWGIVESFTADAEKTGECAGACLFRFNCTSYTSGTIKYVVSKYEYGRSY